MRLNAVLAELRLMRDPESAAGMARYGIKADRALGVSIPKLAGLAKTVGQNRKLAGQLWSCGIHEARILACMIDDPRQVTEAQLEHWVKEFDSWDLCDQCCNRLFRKSEFAHQKAVAWASRPDEFVKRAGRKKPSEKRLDFSNHYPTNTHSTSPSAEDITLTASSMFKVAVFTTRS